MGVCRYARYIEFIENNIISETFRNNTIPSLLLYVSYLLFPQGSKATDMIGESVAIDRDQDLWGRRNLSFSER
jgi:hypothetical protein